MRLQKKDMYWHVGSQVACLEGLCLQEGVGVALQCSQLLRQQRLKRMRGAAAGLAQLPHKRQCCATRQHIPCACQLGLQGLQQTCTTVRMAAQ